MQLAEKVLAESCVLTLVFSDAIIHIRGRVRKSYPYHLEPRGYTQHAVSFWVMPNVGFVYSQRIYKF